MSLSEYTKINNRTISEDDDHHNDDHNNNNHNNSDDCCSSIEHPENVEDRLSYLPDALLVTILSLLPLHSAVATSILSRQWRYLWTRITSIYIRFPPLHRFQYHTAYKRDRFQSDVATVDEIMAKLDSPIIHTFDIKLSRDLSSLSVSSSCLVSSLQHVCRCNPVVVNVNLGSVSTFFTRFCQIPISVFQTQSLIKLHLQGNLYFGFADDDDPTTIMSSFTLPNLKELVLHLSDDLDIASVGRLFPACPLLEDLSLTLYFRQDDDIVVDLSSVPSLKRLRINVMATEVEGCIIVLDAPNLETCNITGDLAFYDFVTIPSNLQVAAISITETSFGDEDDNLITKISGLIQGISCVKCLILEDYGIYLLDCITYFDAPLPIFCNLFTLRLHIDCWTGELPGSFFLGNLKRVELQDVACQDVEINLVQHILTNATTLEELHVWVHPEISLIKNHQEGYDFCKKLFMLPKSSVNCLILISGTVDSASSEDFKDGELTFRSKNDDSDWVSDSDNTVDSDDTY